ncbi:MAG: hypothetical protein HY827_07065 [Actinobacteria bacterium]|nr:hypothetical protein [Actinomycetota bacterium]
MSSSWQRFAVGSVAAVLALLVMSNALLLKMALDDDPVANTDNSSQKQQTALPSLPPPSSNGSSKLLLKELNKTKRQFKEPVSQALADLQSVSSSAGTLDQLPALLNEMIASTATLEDVAPQLRALVRRIRSLNRQITRMSKFTTSLGPVVTDFEVKLRDMSDDLDRIRQCTEKPSTCS